MFCVKPNGYCSRDIMYILYCMEFNETKYGAGRKSVVSPSAEIIGFSEC